jgi:hypothetical protein
MEANKKIDYNHNVKIDQVYAQALYLLQNGMPPYFDLKESQVIQTRNEMFRLISTEEDYILKYFSNPTGDENEKVEFKSASDIIEHIHQNIPTRYKPKLYPNIIGQIMQRQGYIREKVKNRYGYYVVLNEVGKGSSNDRDYRDNDVF